MLENLRSTALILLHFLYVNKYTNNNTTPQHNGN